jgi:predicted CXXCH cytochrome family protein
MRFARYLAVALLAAAPVLAPATDAPHEANWDCSNCHMGHSAPGVSLTNRAGNANLCQSCHVDHPGKFGFPWAPEDQAVPGESGISHRWDAPATNMGATPPIGTPMGDKDRLSGGTLQCSTCHDQHAADDLLGEPADPTGLGTQHTSFPVDVAQNPTSGGTGRTLTLVAPVGAAAAAKGYIVEIVEPGSDSNATFKLSNDNGTSWFGCVTQNDYTYVTFAANPCKVGAGVPLNDGTNVAVTFTGSAGTFLAGDRWSFYVSYPYLRVSNKDGEMCTTCHKDRHMYWQDVEGGAANGVSGGRQTIALGTTVFHHPVGQALRSPPAGGILDADGTAQSPGDTNKTNDLTFGTGGIVTCLTCHRPHNADSNSLTDDSL